MTKHNQSSIVLMVLFLLLCISLIGNASATDTENNTGPTVTASLTSGTYNTAQSVGLTANDSSAIIYYTKDGSDPRTSGSRVTYTGPITINTTTTLRYAAIDTTGNLSPLYLQNYVIGTGTVTNNTGQSNYTGPETNTTEWNYVTHGGYMYVSDGTYSANVGVIGAVTGSITIGTDGTIYVPTTYALYAFNSDKTLKWILDLGVNSVSILNTPVIAADGNIYVASMHYIYAVNPNGTIKWKYTIKHELPNYNNNWIIDAPAIGADGTIYIADNSGNIYALNPDGILKWTSKISGIDRIPAIGADGTLYFGSTNGIYAINPDGTIKWTYINSTGSIYPVLVQNPDQPTHWTSLTVPSYSSPVIGADSTIYIGGNDGILYAFNENGTLKWTYTANACINYISISKDGTIYFETNNGTYVYQNAVYYQVSNNATLYALTDNGTQAILKWSYSIPKSSMVSKAIIGADGTIYLAIANIFESVGSEGKIYAINPNGTVKWTYAIDLKQIWPGFAANAPTISPDGTLYFGTTNGYNNAGMTYAISDHVVPNTVTNLRTGKTYTSIQAAINDSVTLDGDNIKVTAGTYTENVNVNKKVNILAYGIVTVTAANNSNPVFTITQNGSGSTIIGFNINGGWSGVSMINAQNCSINYNTIENYTNYRIYLKNSNPASIIFGKTVLPTVTANISSGTYNSSQLIQLITADSVYCRIYYTTDGSDPTTNSENYYDILGAGRAISETNSTTTNSPLYEMPISINKTTTFKYMVLNAYYTLSPIYSIDIVIDITAPTVTSNPAGGNYYGPQNVTLTTTDENITKTYYTTDGTDPTNSSTKKEYNGTILINTSKTLKFAAVDSVNNWSSVYTAKYTIYKKVTYTYTVKVPYKKGWYKYKSKKSYKKWYKYNGKWKYKWVTKWKYKWVTKWNTSGNTAGYTKQCKKPGPKTCKHKFHTNFLFFFIFKC